MKIMVLGSEGLVGSAIAGELLKQGYRNVLFVGGKNDCDLRNQKQTRRFFNKHRPDWVFLAAAKVGGIMANQSFPADFIYDNLIIQTNVIKSCYMFGVNKLMFLGSSCIYPKKCPQPIKESYLLGGKLEPTNEPYAVAKIAGIKLCQAYNDQYDTNFISVMPTNIYGENDNFDPDTSHIIAALLSRFRKAELDQEKEVVVWGTGKPRREFMYVGDLAEACVFLMERYHENEIINIGTGEDISIVDLAILIKKITGFKGKVVFDSSKPDGTMVKRLDVSKINKLGWKATTKLEDGLVKMYRSI